MLIMVAKPPPLAYPHLPSPLPSPPCFSLLSPPLPSPSPPLSLPSPLLPFRFHPIHSCKRELPLSGE